MDLRAFWRVVAMVCGISVYQSDFGCVAVLLHVIYNNHAEHAFTSKNSAKNEKKNPQGEVTLRIYFCAFCILSVQRKISCCEKIQKLL